MAIDAWELYYIQKNEDKCTHCYRKIIQNMTTKNGCVWCDVKYYKEQIDKNLIGEYNGTK